MTAANGHLRMRPCACDRCAKPGPFRAGDCPHCWLYHNRADYRALWDGGTTTPGRPAVAARPPCRFLGEPTGELRDCPTCAGTIKLKLFACSIYQRCTTATSLPGLACCVGCPSYQPPERVSE